jgi:hypothetical protein
MNFLFTLPSEKSNSIPALRSVANRHCDELAKSVHEDADTVWESAMLGKFEGRIWDWDSVKANLFKESFFKLQEMELREIQSLLPV